MEATWNLHTQHSAPNLTQQALEFHRPSFQNQGQSSLERQGTLPVSRPSPEGKQFKVRDSSGHTDSMEANDFSFFAIPWVEKWRNRFHTSRFFSKEQLGKCWCGVLIHFSYNAINYIKTQLSHSFKILKYFSAKTQKDICGIPQSLSEKLHARTSHLGSTRQELNKGNTQLAREPRCLSGQAPSASSRDANGIVCCGPAQRKVSSQVEQTENSHENQHGCLSYSGSSLVLQMRSPVSWT